MDDGELERLADEAVDVLVWGLGAPGWADWAAVRAEFVVWFGRRGLDAYGQDLAAVNGGRGASPSIAQMALWRRQLLEGIRRSSNPMATDELRALIDRFGPNALLAPPKDGSLLGTGQSPSLPPLGEHTDGDHIDLRNGTFNAQVVGVQHVSNTYAAPSPGDAQPGPLEWPLAKDIEPRTHGVRPTRRVKGLPALPPYVGRDRDATVNSVLEQASSEGGLVVVLGPAYAGKSRTALAAMAQVLPDRPVFVPTQHEELRKLPALLRGRPERCVVWLDDLDDHLGDGGLEQRLLAQLTGLEAVVLATMREEAYETYVGTSAKGRLLSQAQLVELPRAWGPAELKRAGESEDPRLTEAARECGSVGVASYLAIGPRLWNDWQLGPNRERHPRAYALVRAAIDLARCGLKGPLPQDLLVKVHEGYGLAGLERESLADAWEWVGRKRYGVLRTLRRGEGEKGPFADVVPYLVHTAEQDETFPPVAEWVWGCALEAARANPVAYDVDSVVAGAREVYLREAETGNGWAMHSLGLLEESLGEGEKAESWFRRAAEAGQTESARHLGRLFVQRGESREAETFLELAAQDGDGDAATLLGKLLLERAERWLRAGAQEGNPEAAHRLGGVLLGNGEVEAAGERYGAAASAGYTEVALSMALCLLLYNQREKAEVWLGRAASDGDERANYLQRLLKHEPGSPADAETHFADNDAWPLDIAHYGVVLEKQGHPDEARDQYTKAHESGDSYGAYRLATLLEKQGKPEEAKLWYRKATDMGHPATPDTVKE
ncbi:tetratricopeptide repeat protein [Streptomyces sp. cg40]|uniref:tetratricopeptide repeat protein n=1 Tax=Streptomyces sp. cg40 TaxID=3419764 RepID=UPI003D00D7CE